MAADIGRKLEVGEVGADAGLCLEDELSEAARAGVFGQEVGVADFFEAGRAGEVVLGLCLCVVVVVTRS